MNRMLTKFETDLNHVFVIENRKIFYELMVNWFICKLVKR